MKSLFCKRGRDVEILREGGRAAERRSLSGGWEGVSRATSKGNGRLSLQHMSNKRWLCGGKNCPALPCVLWVPSAPKRPPGTSGR
jgi:hypothetical protein